MSGSGIHEKEGTLRADLDEDVKDLQEGGVSYHLGSILFLTGLPPS